MNEKIIEMNRLALIFIFLSFLILSSESISCQIISIHKNDTNYVLIYNEYFHKDSITISYDPNEVGYRQIVVLDYAFLISDSMYYDFYIDSIQRMQDGYFITAYTEIMDSTVRARIVTFDEELDLYPQIKKGETFSLKLRRYYDKPLRRKLEYKFVYPVLYNDKYMPILSTGSFSYLFFTDNIKGLYYISPENQYKIEKPVESDINNICNLLNILVEEFTLSDSMKYCYELFDTISVKKSLANLHFWYHDFSDMDSVERKTYGSWPIIFDQPNTFERIDWKMYDVDENDFSQLLLKYIDLSIGDKVKMDICIQYCRLISYKNGLYTFQVKWLIKEPDTKKIIDVFVANFSIKKSHNNYKIIAFTIIR